MSNEQCFFTREHGLIESIKEWTDSPFIGDDCAVVLNGVLLTTDTLVEGTHFLLPLISWRDLGWKSVAVNLSDVAAMAGRPRNLLISITVPPDLEKSAFREVYEAMIECSRIYKTKIVGGDLTKGPVLSISVTVQGEVHENGCLLRSGAQAGDLVVVTGDFGASRAGLWVLLNQPESFSVYQHAWAAHVHPLPRLSEAWSMVRRTGGRGALMDASDGLGDAISQICKSSNVGMDIDLEKLPIHAETISIARLAGADPVDWALYGGEDYELVGCIAESSWKDWTDDNPFTVIGRVKKTVDINLLYGDKAGPQLNLSKCFEQIEF